MDNWESKLEKVATNAKKRVKPFDFRLGIIRGVELCIAALKPHEFSERQATFIEVVLKMMSESVEKDLERVPLIKKLLVWSRK